LRRPAPVTLADLKPPGPRAEDRHPYIPCRADAVSVEIAGDQPLLEALGDWATKSGYASAVLNLGDVSLAAFDYVTPDRAIDDCHAAWYSDTHSTAGAVLQDAVAILGWRNGNWFAHIHAYWREGGKDHLGHLMPASLTTAAPVSIAGHGIKGAAFDAGPDPETEFTLFRVRQDRATAVNGPNNALITTLAPFADLHRSVTNLAKNLATPAYQIMGLGSLAGAEFRDDHPMTGLISEILLMPGAGDDGSNSLWLPVRCIDLNGHLHHGAVRPDKAPILITCELLIRSTDAASQGSSTHRPAAQEQ